MIRQTLAGFAIAGALAVAVCATPAMAQAPAVYLDLAAEAQVRAELFACLRRKLGANNVATVEADNPGRTHTLGVRAMITRTNAGASGYAASVIVLKAVSPDLQARIVSSLPAEERAKTLVELAPYGTVALSRLIIAPRNVQKLCDVVSNEIETGLFDTSGQAKLPAR